MAISLDKAKQVIPKQRAVRLGGQQIGDRETLAIDVEKQSMEDIGYLVQAITEMEAGQQERLNNPPTRIIVDNKEGRDPRQAKKRTEVFFGDTLHQAVINTIKRSLMAEIRKAVAGRTGDWNRATRQAMTSSSAWEWVYVDKPRGKGRKVNPYKIGPMPVGSRLILRPRVPDVEYENMLALWRDIGYRRPGNVQGKGDKGVYSRGARSKGQGFMAKSIGKLKRGQLMRNFTIYAAFTKRYEPAGSKFYKQGSPIIVIRALRKQRRYARRIK